MLRSDYNNKKISEMEMETHMERERESTADVVSADVRSREKRVFLFLTVVLAPLVAVAVVGSYGLLIWLYQMFMGPPKG